MTNGKFISRHTEDIIFIFNHNIFFQKHPQPPPPPKKTELNIKNKNKWGEGGVGMSA